MEDRALVLLAEQELISRCMADQGFDYPAVAPTVDELRDLDQSEAQAEAREWFGSDDLQVAERDGYGHADRYEEEEPVGGSIADGSDPIDGLNPQERAAYGTALNGFDGERVSVELPFGNGRLSMFTSGCIWEAREQLYGDVVGFLEVSLAAGDSGRRFRVMERVQVDPQYQATLGQWRDCMRGAGHPYESPAEASEEISELFWHDNVDLPVARAREREVAVADATCSQEVGLATVAADLSGQYESEVAAEMEADILAFQDLHAEAVARARVLLDLD